MHGLPVGFLRACGPRLCRALAAIATASLKLEYYPATFKKARVVVIPKPGKPPEVRSTTGGWRLISLLSTLGKVVETAIGRRIANAAEKRGLLPEGQIGNRTQRSTELAIKVVVEAAKEAWAQGGLAALLQLDIKGAFDTVHHERLVKTMRKLGYPEWLVNWLKSFLAHRISHLSFDGEISEEFHIRTGVPQGSPLSPILFLLYIASLYEELQREHPQLLLVGFADDTNLMAVGYSELANCKQLEDAWGTCERWARSRGMEFAPQKSELMHFTRTRRAPKASVMLGEMQIQPVESARFLGVWLDRKLRWRAHLEKV